MSILDKPTSTALQHGLNKDYTHKPGTFTTFVLNGIRDSHDGGKTQYQSEPGNTQVEGITPGYTICGWIYGQNNEIYLLSTNDILSEIGIFKDGFYTTVVQTDLEFDPRYPITGEYRLKNGCERIIYWCDGHNPDYFFNFDRPELFKDDLGNWDPNLFRLVPKILPPKIDLVSVNDTGGNLPLGSYYFQIEILDSTLNSLYKTDISPQTIIFDESLGNVYAKIDGGLNIAQYSAEVGGVPTTTKSISLRFYNLNTNFAFLRVNVARQITGTQVIDAHAVGTLIPIGSSDFTWTYTGYNVSNGDYPLDYSEMLVSNVRYDTAYVMEQVQGRLVRAALKQDVRDYSKYQRDASKIEVRWYSEEILRDDVTQLGNEKNPETYWLKTSMQGDEVYALGIQYLHDDGTWSPMFHIPGKPPTVADMIDYIVVDSSAVLNPNEVWESEVEHLDQSEFTTWAGTYIGSTIKSWKFRSLATVTNSYSGTHPFINEGRMGYYECDETYPDIRDCDNALIWGQDYLGNNITTDTKIRHHRLPDRGLIGIWTGDQGEYIRPLGLKFRNLAYPDPSIVGHRFGYVVRDESNKTVVDSGWFVKEIDDATLPIMNEEGSFVHSGINPQYLISFNASSGSPGQLTGRYGSYVSQNMLFNKKIYPVSYIKTNRIHSVSMPFLDLTPPDFDLTNSFPEIYAKTGGGELIIGALHFENQAFFSDTPNRKHYKINKQVFLEPKEKLFNTSLFPVKVFNSDTSAPANIIECNYEIENTYDVVPQVENSFTNYYVYKKQYRKPYGNLFNLQYKYLNFNYIDSIDPNDNIIYNGDTIISKSIVNKDFFGFGAGTSLFVLGSYQYLYEEHEINGGLRHGGTLDSTGYYKGDRDYSSILNRRSELVEAGTYTVKKYDDITSEYYAYNKDFDKQNVDVVKQSIPITYNYCSDCLGEFSSRIIFSPKSFDEESFDLYRINKVNDYIDLPGYRGQITGLKYKNNVLLAHCREGTFLLQPNPQAISTNISDIYLTTGDFLGLPPSEMLQTDVGYAGCQSKQHQCDTPNGWCWVDQIRSQIFKFDGKVDELSNKGLTQWFNDNLPSEMQSAFYQVFQTEYGNQSTLSIENDGIGLIMFYDPKYNRLFISKKDFLPINFTDRATNIGDLSYNFNNGYWEAVNSIGEKIIVFFGDIDWFENKSWTISYSFDYENSEGSPWVSWHSYIPPFAFWDNYYYYTMPVPDFGSGFDVRAIYRHDHEGNYQSYYGNKYDFIIEWMDFTPETKNFNAVHYNGYTLRWDPVHKQWIQDANVTFDRGMFYNYAQTTGLVNLQLINQHSNPYGKIETNNTTKYIVRNNNNYKISGLYDLAVGTPVITSRWEDIKNNYFIDVVPLNSNISTNKSSYQLNNLRNEFLLCRLYFNSEADYKKVITLIQNHDSISIR